MESNIPWRSPWRNSRCFSAKACHWRRSLHVGRDCWCIKCSTNNMASSCCSCRYAPHLYLMSFSTIACKARLCYLSMLKLAGDLFFFFLFIQFVFSWNTKLTLSRLFPPERLWSKNETVSGNINFSVLPRLSYFRCLLNRRGVNAAPVNNFYARSAPTGPGSCYDQ